MSIKFKTFKWANIHFDDIETIEAENEGDPRLYKTPNGLYPSMTSILGIISDKKSLEAWINYVGEDEANKIVDEALNRGNQLHDINEKYLRNNLTRKEVKGQGGTLFNRVKKYLDEIDLIVGCEVALYSDTFTYAGRADCIGVVDDKLMIIDHKNTRKKFNLNIDYHKEKMYHYMLQTTGYQIALEEMTGYCASHGCLIVGNHLNSNSNRFIFEICDKLKNDVHEISKAYHSGIINKRYIQYFNLGTKNEFFPKLEIN